MNTVRVRIEGQTFSARMFHVTNKENTFIAGWGDESLVFPKGIKFEVDTTDGLGTSFSYEGGKNRLASCDGFSEFIDRICKLNPTNATILEGLRIEKAVRL
jgi:hypothetical protein